MQHFTTSSERSLPEGHVGSRKASHNFHHERRDKMKNAQHHNMDDTGDCDKKANGLGGTSLASPAILELCVIAYLHMHLLHHSLTYGCAERLHPTPTIHNEIRDSEQDDHYEHPLDANIRA